MVRVRRAVTASTSDVFPNEDAALVLLTNSAGPLFGPPGGSAVFDDLLADVLALLGVPELTEPLRLARGYPPLLPTLTGTTADRPNRRGRRRSPPARRCGVRRTQYPSPIHRIGRRHPSPTDDPSGGMPIAIEDGLLYLGPFAVPRN